MGVLPSKVELSSLKMRSGDEGGESEREGGREDIFTSLMVVRVGVLGGLVLEVEEPGRFVFVRTISSLGKRFIGSCDELVC